jgi:hypothetical protein
MPISLVLAMCYDIAGELLWQSVTASSLPD